MAKIIGFTAISAEAFIAAYQWMLEEGTCCLAYGDWTEKAESLLLSPEQRQYKLDVSLGREKLADLSGDDVLGMIDCELIDAMVMLPVLKIVDTPSLYWDTNLGRISAKPFPEAEYAIDLSEEFPADELNFNSSVVRKMVMKFVELKSVVPFTDVDYYTGRIADIYGLSSEEAAPYAALLYGGDDGGPTRFTSLAELSEYCSNECVERTVYINVTIKFAEHNYGADQTFNWRVATAIDYNMLEAAVKAAVDMAVSEEASISYFFEIIK